MFLFLEPLRSLLVCAFIGLACMYPLLCVSVFVMCVDNVGLGMLGFVDCAAVCALTVLTFPPAIFWRDCVLASQAL